MAYITYTGPFEAVTTPDGTTFKRGESVKISDELARSLLRRNDFMESKNEDGDE